MLLGEMSERRSLLYTVMALQLVFVQTVVTEATRTEIYDPRQTESLLGVSAPLSSRDVYSVAP